ncbi:hypothetical protein NC652_037523 [Populus alba x Populus x berolinensis]|nr:hypothetical protein NC652_037523 [Populus alba x Populus x berolinensis]
MQAMTGHPTLCQDMGRIATLPCPRVVVRCPSFPTAINIGEGIEKRTGESHYTTIDLFISRAKASKPKPEKDQQKNTKDRQRKKNKRREKGIENRDCGLCTEKKKNRPHPLGTTAVSSSPSPPTATPRVSNRQQRSLPPFSFPAAAP